MVCRITDITSLLLMTFWDPLEATLSWLVYYILCDPSSSLSSSMVMPRHSMSGVTGILDFSCGWMFGSCFLCTFVSFQMLYFCALLICLECYLCIFLWGMLQFCVHRTDNKEHDKLQVALESLLVWGPQSVTMLLSNFFGRIFCIFSKT